MAAAGLHIGSLYENLYAAIIALDVPTDLSREDRDVYRAEVRQRVAVLVKKAIMVYEKSLAIGKTADTAAAWIERLERALERLRAIYLHENDVSTEVEGTRGLTPRGETVQ